MVILPLTNDVINERIRRKKKEYSKKNKGMELKDSTIELLKWSIMIRSADSEKIKAKDIYKIYSLRWSIELVFKLWKSELDFDYICAYKEDRMLFEIYGKLISVLLFINFNKVFINTIDEKYEISLVKSLSCYKLLIKEILKSVFSEKKLQYFFERYKPLLLKKCIKKSYRRRKTTLAQLETHNKGGFRFSYEIH